MAKRRKTARWRASWKGQLQFGLVSFSVEAINVRSHEEGDIHFHQLHAKCHNRIHYEKVCPIHGQVDNDEIVSGYEYARGKYVEIEPEELDELRTDKERALTIDSFVKPDEVDPIYFDGRMYYLTPSGPESKESYRVLCAALEKQGRWGVGHVVMSGKDQIVVIRPKNDVLVMAMLNYAAEIRPVEELKLAVEKVAPRNMKLAQDLIKSWSAKRFDFERYEDLYRNRVAELIEAKVAGHESVSPDEEEEEPPVINLMDALKRSVAKAKSQGKRSRSSPPHKSRKATSKRRKAS